jgi:hypothetical protein
MKNWQALGDSAKAEISKRWAIGCAVFLLALVFLPDNKLLDLLSRVGSLALLLSWYYSIGKPQAALVLGRYGAAHPRRGWAKPLGLALLALLGFVIIAGAVGFTAAMFTSEA